MCQLSRNSPPPALLHPWEWPAIPWSRLRIDYAGPYLGRMLLIVIDSHSKWLDVLPDKIVSDNRSVFTTREFADFMASNGISHVKVASHHPSSNGLAEWALQIFKRNMEHQTSGTLKTKLARFLFNYRTTPHFTTTTSPAQLLMGRKLKTRLNLLHPDLQKKVESSVQRQKYSHDQHARVRPSFNEGDKVYIHNFSDGGRWIEGIVIKILGSLSYLVKISNGLR